MNLHAQPDLAYAITHGWVSAPQPMKSTRDKWVERNYARGLTARGTPRKSRPPIRAEIIAQAQRDGVGVTAIYNRLKRSGTMKPSNHPNSKGVCHV